jgi:transmembrane sensor
MRFDARQRLIVLQEGEIMVETGHGDARPFIVETREGSMRALGTRFLVKREAQGTRLSVLQSAVAAHPQSHPEEQILREGQQVLIRNDGLDAVARSRPAPMPGPAACWWWTTRDWKTWCRTGRYRRGHLGVAPEVADLRITGSFPLHDTDKA